MKKLIAILTVASLFTYTLYGGPIGNWISAPWGSTITGTQLAGLATSSFTATNLTFGTALGVAGDNTRGQIQLDTGGLAVSITESTGIPISIVGTSVVTVSGGSVRFNGAATFTNNVVFLGATTYNIATKSSSYPLVSGDGIILLNGTTLTATLPTAVGITGKTYTIKEIAASSGTVATTSSQTIDASTTYALSAQYKYVTVVSDGANWKIIANN
jgi:hypothetical protein